jgi:hypothetical protein
VAGPRPITDGNASGFPHSVYEQDRSRGQRRNPRNYQADEDQTTNDQTTDNHLGFILVCLKIVQQIFAELRQLLDRRL